MTENKIIIITGLSGSGKSTAIKALEDVGFFCVDNLPVALLPNFLEIRMGQESGLSKLALVMDIREKRFVSDYAAVLDSFKRLRVPGAEAITGDEVASWPAGKVDELRNKP